MNILLLSHSTGVVGPIDFLENYLVKKNKVFKIEHPLDDYKNKQTVVFENKKILFTKPRKQLGIFNIAIDFMISLWFVLRSNIDVCIGANNIDTLVAILAKKVCRKNIKKIIYFASDFSENRFNNKILDNIYLSIERFVLTYADTTISNTKRAEAKRITLGLAPTKSIVIPNGIELANPVFKNKKIDKSSFIFIGNVTKEHGLLDFLSVLQPVIKKLVVIGQGDQWEKLVSFVKENKIQTELHFLKSHAFVIDYLQNFPGIGLAPYNRISLWTYYCSPLKVNEYIACGIPVLMSNVPEISETVKESNLGVVYEKMALNEVKENIKDFNTKDFYKKAQKFYEKYNYDNLYAHILN